MTGKLTSRPSFLLFLHYITVFVLESHTVMSEQAEPPPHLSIIATFHEWVVKLNDATYEERRLYTEVPQVDRIPLVKSFEYPRSNQTKLNQISELWEIYYTCLKYQFLSLGPLKIMHPDAVAVLDDAVLHLSCMICVSPRVAHKKIEWYKKKRLGGESVRIKESEFVTISNDHVLSIYKVTRKDAGIYWCESGSAKSQNIYAHILNASEPTKSVRPCGAHVGPYVMEDEPLFGSIYLTTRWNDWNQCSTCGIVGRRTKWGACFVKSDIPLKMDADCDPNVILSLFVNGLPCRSSLLPKAIRNRPEVLRRPNEIMTGLCKVPCVDEIFEVRNDQGEIVLMVNNSDGFYSTLQMPPKLPPVVVREIKWPLVGQPLTITCPGSLAVDTPTEWKINMEKLLFRPFVNWTSQGRVHIDVRDRIVFKEILPSDGHRYVCYQNNKVAGIVSVIPVQTPPNIVEIDAILLICFLAILLLTSVARTFYFNRRLVRAVEKDF